MSPFILGLLVFVSLSKSLVVRIAFSPAVKECSDVKIDRVYIGSCTGGKSEDFLAAAKLLHKAQLKVKVPTFLVPATQKVWADLYGMPVPECDGKTAAEIFEEAGCVDVAAPSCAACLGGPKDTFARMNEPEV